MAAKLKRKRTGELYPGGSSACECSCPRRHAPVTARALALAAVLAVTSAASARACRTTCSAAWAPCSTSAAAAQSSTALPSCATSRWYTWEGWFRLGFRLGLMLGQCLGLGMKPLVHLRCGRVLIRWWRALLALVGGLPPLHLEPQRLDPRHINAAPRLFREVLLRLEDVVAELLLHHLRMWNTTRVMLQAGS